MKRTRTFLLNFSKNEGHLFLNSKKILLILLTILSSSCETDQDFDNDFEENSSFERSSSSTPRVLVNGVPLRFERTQPEENGQKIMIPAIEVINRLGYTSEYNEHTKTLVSTKDSKRIEIKKGAVEAKVNGKTVNQLAAPYLKNDVLMIESNFFSNLNAIFSEYDQETRSLQLYHYDELDYGLYFFGKQNIDKSDAVGCQKFISGQENLFYDPNKPTIIWVHGWQNGGVETKYRDNFHLEKNGINKYMHNEWLKRGWNVAIFSWIALADELLPYDAESKINSSTTNGVGMRWKKADGSYVTRNTPNQSVAELFANAYETLVESQKNPKIRLAGSSFGGQVVLHGAEIIQNKGISPLPNRIALLDMAWTRNYVVAQNMFTNRITARAAKSLNEEVLIEYYRSSALTTFFTPRELVEASAYQEMVFGYAGNLDIELKHTAITQHYLWSLEYEAPNAYDGRNNATGVGLSASTDDNTLREMMEKNYHWQHIDGRNSFDPGDDTFERQNGVW